MRQECAEVATALLKAPLRQYPLAVYSASDEIEAYGEVQTLATWARLRGVAVSSLRRRFSDLPGLAPEVVIALPSWARVDPDAAPGAPRSWTWDALPWKDDAWAQDFVATHPDGGTLEEVGAAIGIVRERVRQVEESAVEKVLREARRQRIPLKGDVPRSS